MPRKNAVSILFQATPEEKEQLQAYCEAHQRSQTEILRELIRTLPKATQGNLLKGHLIWGRGGIYFVDQTNEEYSMKLEIKLPDGSSAATTSYASIGYGNLPLKVELPQHPPIPITQKVKSLKSVTVELVDNVVVRIAEIH